LVPVIFLLVVASALAAVNCSPPSGQDWIFNSSNSTLVCDNGTAIDLGAYSLILNDNATATFTNGTNLTATQVLVNSTNASFHANESSTVTATLNITAGNATFDGAALAGPAETSGTLLFSNGAALAGWLSILNGTTTFNATNVTNVTSVNITGTLILENGLYTPTQINVYKGPLTATNATILTGEFSIGTLVSPYSAATAVLTDTVLNATSFTIGNMSTLTTDNLTSNATLVIHENATATLDRSTLNITASGATLTSGSWLVGDVSLNESAVATLTDVNGSITAEDANLTVNGTANNTITILSSTFTLNGEAQNVNATTSNVTMTGSSATLFTLTNGLLTATNSALNVTSTNTLLTMTSVNASTLVGTRSSVLTGVIATSATLSGNNTFSDYTGENLTLAGNGLSSGDLNITGTLFLNDNHALTLNDSSVATLASTGNGTALLDGNLTITGLGAFTQTLTRVYPLYLVNESGAPVSGKTVRVLRSLSNTSDAIWNGTSDASGYLEPSVTFNSTNDTFYLYVPGYTLGQNVSFALLNDTPLNWSIDATGPSFNITLLNSTVSAGSFGFQAELPADAVLLRYRIHNATANWTTISSVIHSGSAWNETQAYDGIYLPAGDWTVNLTAYDTYNNSYATNATVTSQDAILSTLMSAADQSATIGGSDIGFTFTVTTKGAGAVVEAFLNLTNGDFLFDNGYLALNDGTANVSVGAGGDYAGAGNVTLPAITAGATPSYVNMSLAGAGIYQQNLTLLITPYSGLSAGTYSGSYGFGVFG